MSNPDRVLVARADPASAGRTRLALASRGDALTPYLFDALERRFPIVGRIAPELTAWQRYQVAALTVQPTRRRWVERFYKSAYASQLRSANAVRQLGALGEEPAAVFQVHALFSIAEAPTVLYIDCTHRQSAELWPAWNPLRGRALEQWYRREQRSYTAATHLFAFCEATRLSLVHDYGVAAEKVTVTGAGANLSVLPDLPQVSHAGRRTHDGPPTILFIGNDFVRKGGEVLLEAFRRVRTVLPEARLQLIGTDPALTAEPGVDVLGRIHDRARIMDLYTAASVFVMPSLFDPYPLVLLEAMAFGLPVVATDQMGTPEMIVDGETGLLVERRSPDALADALLQVLQDDALAERLGSAARRSVEERFTWDAVVDRMAPVLQDLPVRSLDETPARVFSARASSAR